MEEHMDLIDRYIEEVGKHLPEKQRADIQAEIGSALQDMLEDRAGGDAQAIDEAMVVSVLKEYGAPEKVAASYLPERYLIGPRLYPAFLKTVQIALPIVLALGVVGFGVAMSQTAVDTESIIETIVKALSEVMSSLVGVLGSIVLVYTILERTMPDLKEKPRDWDPRSLAKIAPPDRVGPGEPITQVIFTLAALVIFNFYPHFIAFRLENGVSLPVLSETFWGYLPVLNLLWIAQVVLQLALVYRGHWQLWTRWFSLGVQGLEIGVALAMLRGPALIGLTAARLAEQGPLSLDSAETIVMLLHQVVRVPLILILVIGTVAIVKTGLRLVARRAPVLVQG
jgi:hypothetical protein